MSELVLVRHGQASFGSDSYDQLSERGFDQVRKLRQHWSELGHSFDHVCSGSLQRQRQTAAELLSLCADGASTVAEESGFNEYDGDPIIQAYLRDHAVADGFPPDLSWPITDERGFQRLLEAASRKWIRDELETGADCPGFERWRDFRDRVHAALDRLMATHRDGSQVLVATSAGVIAAALQRVLNFPDEQVISTSWMVHNSSVTRIRYGGGRVSLTLFNALPHLERSDRRHLVTYR